MSAMEFHPLANLFPMLDERQAGELTSDIRANGLRQAIVTFDGKILDGRNRYLACVSAGVEPRFKEFTGADPLGYVVSLNMTRRHLSESQRALVAAKIANMRQGERTDLAPIGAKSQTIAAELMNVSRRSVQRASEVLDHGSPELITRVELGEVSVAKASKIAHSLAPEPYIRPADKYFAAQEARLGPVCEARADAPAPKISDALKSALKGNRATLVSWMRQHHDAGIPAVLAALAGAIAAIERHLDG
jgi:hypothetical protein